MARTVLCRLLAGAVLEQDGQTIFLDYGINDAADPDAVERWLQRNARLACVRTGQVCIADDGRAERVRLDIRKKTA
jgi:hypothetical protein